MSSVGSARIWGGDQFNLKKAGAKKLSWDKAVMASPADLPVTRYSFAYAVIRTSITGFRLGIRGTLAGLHLAAACLPQLKVIHAPAAAPNRLRMHRDFELVKDFLSNGFRGTIGAASAFLAMHELGYPWVGHWEDCLGSGLPAGSRPDFVFGRHSSVCLVDAKGSSMAPQNIEREVKDSWRDQIRHQLNVPLLTGGLPSEGRVICTTLSGSRDMALTIAYGARTAGGSLGSSLGSALNAGALQPPMVSGSVLSAILASYRDVLLLMAATKPQAYSLTEFVADVRPDAPPLNSIESLIDDALSGAQDIYGIGNVAMGGPAFTYQASDGVWEARVFCQTDVLRRALALSIQRPERFEFPLATPVGLDGGVVSRHVSSPNQTTKSSGRDEFLVMGRDGVGAVFKKR